MYTFYVSAYNSQYCANFLHPSFINQGIIFHFANFFIHRSSIRALFYISRIFYSHHWLIRAFCISRISSIFPLIRAFRIPRISYIHLFIDQAFFAFREYHTSIFSLIRAFFLHFASIIHPSFYCSGPFLHISKFIHPFLSLRINLFTFWALIY